MVIIFEQAEDKKTPIKAPQELFWKPDGKAVLVEGKNRIAGVKDKGWKKLTVEEKKRFGSGGYNPVYDLRGKKIVDFGYQDFMANQNKKDVNFLDVIRI